MDMFNPIPLDKQPTQRLPAMRRQDAVTGEIKPLEEQSTQCMYAAGRRNRLPEPIVAKRQGRSWLLYGFSLLFVVLIVSGIFLGSTVYNQIFASKTPVAPPVLQNALHPQTSIVRSSDVENITHQFMEAMLRKNWPVLWSMLAPEAQALWQGEGDFTRFEENKFGQLTLQDYSLGPITANHPWLDPDSTQVYTSAVTLNIALEAAAPSGWLTPPSNSALKQGLFKHTLFALVQSPSNTWQVAIAGPADLDSPVLVPTHTPVTHVILPIFMYHHVSSLPTRNLFNFNLTVTTDDFNKQLDWMQQQGYQSITMTELFDAFYYGKTLPAKPVILTFDDGYADVYTYALPALLAHHYRGVFYIITGIIGGRYLTWDQVRSLARAGMEIGAHTIHHASLAQFPYTQFKTTPQTEIADSKATLELQLSRSIQFFCYPSGEPFHHGSQYARQMVLKDLFEDGYLGATLDPAALNSALQNSEFPYQMPRVRVSGGESLNDFIGILKTTLRNDAARLAHL